MDSRTRVVLQFDPAIQQEIDNEDIDLVRELRKRHPEFNVEETTDFALDASGSKDPVLVILATGAAALAIGSAVARILKAHNGRPREVRGTRLIPLVDANGKQVYDKGRPLFQEQTELKVIEIEKPPHSDDQLSLEREAGGHFKFQFRSRD